MGGNTGTSEPLYRTKFPKGECCYFDSTADSGVLNSYTCPLPEGAAFYCNAQCGNTPTPRVVDAIITVPDSDLESPASLVGASMQEALASLTCNSACATPSNVTYPICDVANSLQFGNASLWADGHVAAYCTEQDLVIWSDGIPNHEVFLEEIPKPPGAPTDQAYASGGDGQGVLRTFTHKSYAYRIPLNPAKASSVTYYTGFGAMAAAVNGMPMYPDDSTSGTSTKADQQLDHCNEHAGEGADVHYHGDPSCMYNNSRITVVGYAGDGYPVYGLLDPDTGKAPTGLDKCNGKDITFPDGTSSYRYFTSVESPYTVTCWVGEPGDLWSNGDQWNYDNSMGRTDSALLARCC